MTATSPSSTPSNVSASKTPSYVALLRGINVGGNNKLPMPALTALFTAAGYSSVRTYIQSGNVIFRAPAGLPPDSAADIANRIEASFGLRVPVILRAATEMQRLVTANPFLRAGLPEALLHVYFLADIPTPSALRLLDYDRSPGDTFAISGRDIYLHMPNGIARSRLSNIYFDKLLGTTSTMRNWRTCTLLADMANQPPNL